MMQRRLAIVLESWLERQPTPNAYDPAWYSMAQLLAHAGLSEADAHIDYLVPAKVEACKVKREEMQVHVQALQERLAAYQPHFVLLLDRWGTLLRAFHGEKMSPKFWRGSVLLAKHITPGIKVMATHAPISLRMDYGLTGVVRFDLRRAAEELRTDGLEMPVDEIDVDLSHAELIARLRDIYDNDRTVGCDIEGYPDWITCIGFATSPNKAFVVPFIRQDGTSWWSEPEEQGLWHWVKLVLEKPTVAKRMHNGSYEMFCLAWTYGIVIEGWTDDTMVMWFEYACEMEKSLGFITSILTKHPWYKHERKSTDDTVALLYNGKDCCRTYEICERMLTMLKPQQMEHYRFNMQLLAPLNYMQLRGIRYDHKEAKRRLAETQEKIYELQDQINQEASKSESRQELRQFYDALGIAARLHSSQVDTRPPKSGADHERSNNSRSCAIDLRGEVTTITSNQPAQPSLEALAPQERGHSLQCGHREDVKVDRQAVEALLPLLTTAFCKAKRLEAREVTETIWQPHKWNGKKWVRSGKRVKEPPTADECEVATSCTWEAPRHEANIDHPCYEAWYQPIHKQVTRNFPAAVTTLEDVQRWAKDSCKLACGRALELVDRLTENRGNAAQRGELATLLGIHIKISASGRDDDEEQEDGTVSRGDERDANWYLYDHCKLPKQWIKDGIRNTDRLASDAKAVVLAWMASGKDEATRDPRALVFAQMKRLLTETKALRVEVDHDKRIRASLNLVGTDTHRISCSASPTRTSRLNLQTITKKHRAMYLADEGCEMGQLDLAGADGWTTAAYSKMIRTMTHPAGDDTMLEDLRAKLKPAQIVVLMLDRGTAVNQMDRATLKELCRDITEEKNWRYFPMKKVVHGSSYKSGKRKVSEGIALDSFKATGRPVYYSPNECERVQQQCFFVRYPGIKAYQNWVDNEIATKGVLIASNGFQRRFFERKDDPATWRKGYAHLPQVYTTYATELAMLRCWSDPENRTSEGGLYVEMLLTVHDSLITQWLKERTEWAKGKQREWFNNPIRIADEMLVIPASGTYGPSWGEQDSQL